ncbi:hypothetical protein ROTAS13_01422 [Roseomonas sp. TAS13]|nr:hypothetical protein ROTAS13_01422 [Roseomonas sp. TAS13]
MAGHLDAGRTRATRVLRRLGDDLPGTVRQVVTVPVEEHEVGAGGGLGRRRGGGQGGHGRRRGPQRVAQAQHRGVVEVVVLDVVGAVDRTAGRAGCDGGGEPVRERAEEAVLGRHGEAGHGADREGQAGHGLVGEVAIRVVAADLGPGIQVAGVEVDLGDGVGRQLRPLFRRQVGEEAALQLAVDTADDAVRQPGGRRGVDGAGQAAMAGPGIADADADIGHQGAGRDAVAAQVEIVIGIRHDAVGIGAALGARQAVAGDRVAVEFVGAVVALDLQPQPIAEAPADAAQPGPAQVEIRADLARQAALGQGAADCAADIAAVGVMEVQAGGAAQIEAGYGLRQGGAGGQEKRRA